MSRETKTINKDHKYIPLKEKNTCEKAATMIFGKVNSSLSHKGKNRRKDNKESAWVAPTIKPLLIHAKMLGSWFFVIDG